MKHLISLSVLMALASTAFAGSKSLPIDAGQMATLLTSPQSASCMNELQSLQNHYQLVTDVNMIERFPAKNGFTTRITYDAIVEGDIGAGTVTLQVNEQLGEQFGLPGSKVLFVSGCSVSKNLTE